jgi:hypothetical protein
LNGCGRQALKKSKSGKTEVKAEFSILLLNTVSEQGVFTAADASLGLASLLYYLYDAGIAAIDSFPNEKSVDIENLRLSAEKFIRNHSGIIYAVSCQSNSYKTALLYSEIIKKEYPDAIIAGGGVHFHSDENIYEALSSQSFDIIFKGGADPFIEFCENLFIKHTLSAVKSGGKLSLNGEIPSQGIYFMRGKAMLSGGYGKFSHPIMPVMHITEDYAEISVLFTDACGNNCDYCSVFKSRSNAKTRLQTEEFVKEAYAQLKEVWKGRFRIALMDSSPFLGKNRHETFGTIDRLSMMDRHLSFSVFADPADLDREFIAFAETRPIDTFFIGRDRINRDPFIGRRLNGVLREQKDLDKEREMLENFIGISSKREIYIGYIASPYDTKQDADALISEIDSFTRVRGETVLQPDIFILNPYGGTAVHKRAADTFWEVSTFSYQYPNVWKAADTRMVWLELLRLVVSPVFSTGSAIQAGIVLLKFAMFMEFGGEQPATEGMTGELKNVIDSFIEDVLAMGLTREKNFSEWQKHILDIYRWGTLISAAVNNPAEIEKYGWERIAEHIKKHDRIINLLKEDMEYIAGENLEKTWYERFLLRNNSG